MTREELIESLTILKEQAHNSGVNSFVWDINLDSFNFVIDNVIKALEQQPCEYYDTYNKTCRRSEVPKESCDAISRQAVKNAICDYVCGKDVRCVENHECRIRKLVSDLPSVTPQPRWISVSERLPEQGVAVLTYDGSCYCVEKRIPAIRDDNGEPILGEWWVSDDYDEINSEYYPNLRDGACIAWMPLPEPYEDAISRQVVKKRTETHECVSLCDDAISRQAVIDGINEYFHDEYYQRTSIQDCRDCLIEDVIKYLPSVTPQHMDAEIQKMQELEQAEIQKAYELGKEDKIKVLNKIRSEIAGLDNAIYGFEGYYMAVTEALEIIDKYRSESEVKDESI